MPFILITMVVAAESRAESPGEETEGAGIEMEARGHIEAGSPGQAIELLRGKTDTIERSLLLARAYLDDGNDFWAMRVLHELVETSEDCSPHLWLAFAHVRQGNLDEGRDVLKKASCPEGSPLEVRRLLLETLIASTHGDRAEAAAALREAAKGESAFPEDVEAFRSLRPSVEENYVSPISGRMELHTGWTSNALAGSPMDPAAAGGPPASPLAQFSGNTRLIVPIDGKSRPTLDVELRGLGVGVEAARDLSYLQLSGRPGFLFGSGGGIFAGYRLESLGILGGDQFDDGPIWFYQAHRGELELDVLPWMTVFGGAGYRAFREARRSRLEADLGAGGVWRPTGNVNVLAALMGRYQSAARDDYDLWGATALMQADLRLPRNVTARFGLMGSVDDYPRSAGYFGTELSRRDLLGKLTAGLWSPRTRTGLRGGVSYELSSRHSTAPDYKYMDHRLLARIQWAFSSDPRGPSSARPPDHVPLAWGLDRENGDLEDSIQDLLRQDEAVRAGSSCVD